MKERWKDIPNFEGLYQVSNLGRVKSLPRKVPSKKWGWMFIQERILKSTNAKGYCAITLSKNGVCTAHRAHQLVWFSFFGPIPASLEINHKNGIKSDNRINNLELLTHQQNMLHASNELQRFKNRKGEQNPRATITEELAKKIKECGKQYAAGKRPWGAIANAARKFGVPRHIIYTIWEKNGWGHLC